MTDVFSEPKYSIASSDYRCLECTGEVACEAVYYSAVLFDAGEFLRRNYCNDCWQRRVREHGIATEGGGRDDETGSGSSGESVFASWRARRPAAPTERPRKVRFDAQFVFDFFLRLGSDGDEAVISARDDGAEREDRGVPHPDTEHTGDARSDDPSGAGDLAALPIEGAEDESAPEVPDDETRRSERDQLRFFLALLLMRKKLLKFKSSVSRDGEEWLLLVDRETTPKVHEVLNPRLTKSQLEKLKDRMGELLQMRI